ncbi:MAG: glutaredoxin domain-containing protein [Mycobacterium sp.]
MSSLTIYGKSDCKDFLRSKALLDGFEVPFRFHDIISDVAAAATAQRISGSSSSPVIVFEDGTFQVEPSDPELAARLGLEPPASVGDDACVVR